MRFPWSDGTGTLMTMRMILSNAKMQLEAMV
jgi:hypothetical protein